MKKAVWLFLAIALAVILVVSAFLTYLTHTFVIGGTAISYPQMVCILTATTAFVSFIKSI